MNKENKILVAMSGGVDSSVVSMLLRREGYDMIGATFRTTEAPCAELSTDAAAQAHALAERLGFEHHVLDLHDEFARVVIADFIGEYMRGRTPNPCVVCNPNIKWGALLKFADKLNCDKMATGHYARIGRTDEGRFFLKRGRDDVKDQTYFLWRLTQEQLSRTVFPLGELTKNDVRSIARENGFDALAEKAESQEICFIPDNDYRSFLESRVPDYDQIVKKGDFIDVAGRKLGEHQGFARYTIGQRKGLGIALGVPAYVVEINAEKNSVTLGSKDDLMKRVCYASAQQWSKIADFTDSLRALAKVRYRTQPVPCIVAHDGSGLRVEFDAPVESITPGQSIVFYDPAAPDDMLGGAIINKAE